MDKELDKEQVEEQVDKNQTLRVEDVQRILCRRATDSEETGMNLCRRPSLLDLIGDRRVMRSTSNSWGSQSYDSNDFDSAVLQWGSTDIDSWLEEIGMAGYDFLFRQQNITTGRRLLSLTEEHLKEIGKGMITVGNRLEILFHIDELRKAAGWVSRTAFVDIPTLLNQSVFIITCKYFEFHSLRLDTAKMQKTLKLYPKRIILIRHGEV